MPIELSDTRRVVDRSLFEALRSIAVSAGYLIDMNLKNKVNISALNQGSKTFTLSNINLTSLYQTSRKFDIENSTANNGQYTIASSSFSGGNTIITVIESIASSTADGVASIYQYYDDDAGVASFLLAQQSIINSKGFVVEIFGVGSPWAKYQKKIPRVVLIPNQSLPGSLGGNGDPVYTPVGSDPLAPTSFTKHVVPPQTVDLTYDVHIVTSSAEQARVCHGIVALGLPKRGYISLITEPEKKFFIESFSYRNIPSPGDDIVEDVYMYKASDLYETNNIVSDEVIKPITEITINTNIGKPDKSNPAWDSIID